MIVHAGGRATVDDVNVARHAEVHDGRAPVGVDQQVLGSPADRPDRPAAKLALDAARHGPSQAAIPHNDIVDCAVDDPRFDAAAARFDFR